MSGNNTGRNYGKHTDAQQAKIRILELLARLSPGDFDGHKKSALGYAAFPNYKFHNTQAAAFSVAKLCRELTKRGLIKQSASAFGTVITATGRKWLAENHRSDAGN
jgi:hypothetical protein